MINWLKGLLYKVQMYDFVSDQFSRCAIDKESLLGDIKDLKAEDKRKYKRIMELTSEVQKYKNQENNDKLFKLEKELIKKYPPAVITYRCRSFPFSKKVISVPINSFITPYDPYIIKDLIRWGLFQTGESHETLLPKIYKKIKKEYYKYEHDGPVWGNNEVWEFPFEVRLKLKEKKGLDCDSWSAFQISYYVAAGVSPILIRRVDGDTSIGGHDTVYVYSFLTKQFHHMNSTYGIPFQWQKEVHKYPTHQDAREGKDKIGIKKVWFSSDMYRCYYDFKNNNAKQLEGFEVEEYHRI